MRRFASLVCMCGVAALAGCANSSKPGMADQPTDQKAMMEQMGKSAEAAAKPGPMHSWLTAGAGTWDGKCICYMDPSGKPQESTCTSTVTPFMNGRFTRIEVHGTMPGFDGKPMSFDGAGVCGYNNETKQFEQNWCDNMGTMQMNSTGTLSPDQKTLTWNAKFMCPIMHKMTWMRQVEKRTGPDTMTLQMWGPDMTNPSKEMKVMEIQFTRSYGSH